MWTFIALNLHKHTDMKAQLNIKKLNNLKSFNIVRWGHGGTLVTNSPPTSEVSVSNPGPNVGNLVVAY